GESHIGPHMAPDKKYYIRAGAHSAPASHFLVEAIRLRRTLEKPLLRGLLRVNPQKHSVIDLVIMTANDAPALNVTVNFEPLPLALAEHFEESFPLSIPVIDKNHPFRMELYKILHKSSIFG